MENNIQIDGNVTISLSDYAKLHRLAKKGVVRLALHNELLGKFSQCLSDIVYEPSMTNEQAEIVIAKVKTLARSLDGQIEFRHDPERQRIVVRTPDE